MALKELKLIPLIHADDLGSNAYNELESLGYDFDDYDAIISLEWETSSYPRFKEWLIETYGNIIQSFEYFAIRI